MTTVKELLEKFEKESEIIETHSCLFNPNTTTNEAMVTFQKSNSRFGEFIIMVGGPGVGKSFVAKNIIAAEFTVTNSDKVLELFANAHHYYKETLVGRTQRVEFDSPDEIDLSNTKVSNLLYKITKPIATKLQRQLLKAMKYKKKDMLPNILVDTTGNDLKKLSATLEFGSELGYRTTLIYVGVTKKEIAWDRNIDRTRTVNRKVFDQIHSNVIGNYKAVIDKADRAWIILSDIDLTWQYVCQKCGALVSKKQLKKLHRCTKCGSSNISATPPNSELVCRVKPPDKRGCSKNIEKIIGKI